VTAFLASVQSRLAATPGVVQIEEELPQRTVRVRERLDATTRMLAERPAVGLLDDLAASWQTTREQLSVWTEVLAVELARLGAERRHLSRLEEVWRRTVEEARRAGGAEGLAPMADRTLAQIVTGRRGVAGAESRLLAVQDEVTATVARCDAALAAIARARRGLRPGLLARDAPPLWKWSRPRGGLAEVASRFRGAVATEVAVVRQFVEEHAASLPLHGLAFVALLAGLLALRRRAAGWPAADTGRLAPARILQFPVAAALIPSLLALPGPLPRVGRALLAVAVLVPAARVLRALVEADVRRWLYVAVTAVVLHQLRELLSVSTALDQWLLLAETVAEGVALGWLLRRGRIERADAPSVSRPLALARRGLGWLALAALAAVALLAAVGYLHLARATSDLVLTSAYRGLVLYAAVRIGESLFAAALRVRPLRLLHLVERHGGLLERRAGTLLRWLALIAWAYSTLAAIDPGGVLLQAVARVLTARSGWGAVSASLGDILAFLLTVWLSFRLSALLRFVFEEDVAPRVDLPRGTTYTLQLLGHYVVILLGFLIGLAALGLDLTRLTILAGALGVGVGLGMQDVARNFVSGLVLLLERPIQVGDAIQLGELEGEVRHIGLRASRIRTWKGAEVTVPNGSLVADRVVNWTLSDRMRRIDLPVGVALGADPDRVRALLLGVARGHAAVLTDPPPLSLFLGFGDGALLFELRVWTKRFEESLVLRSDLGIALHDALRAAGIEIAVPRREVHLRRDPAPPGSA
jgi:small-conductance mechanosensitive channel